MSRFMFIFAGMTVIAGMCVLLRRLNRKTTYKVIVPVSASGPLVQGLEVAIGAVIIR